MSIRDDYLGNVLLIRHGQTDDNARGIYSGRSDISLNKEGIMQAKLVTRRLTAFSDISPFIFTTPIKRGYETAGIIASGLNKKVVVHDMLTELGLGLWTGITKIDASKSYPKAWEAWRNNPEMFQAPEGEWLAEAGDRMRRALIEIVEDSGASRTIVVSHEALIRMSILMAMGLQLNSYRRVRSENCSITELSVGRNGPMNTVLVNDHSHLSNMGQYLNIGGR